MLFGGRQSHPAPDAHLARAEVVVHVDHADKPVRADPLLASGATVVGHSNCLRPTVDEHDAYDIDYRTRRIKLESQWSGAP